MCTPQRARTVLNFRKSSEKRCQVQLLVSIHHWLSRTKGAFILKMVWTWRALEPKAEFTGKKRTMHVFKSMFLFTLNMLLKHTALIKLCACSTTINTTSIIKNQVSIKKPKKWFYHSYWKNNNQFYLIWFAMWINLYNCREYSIHCSISNIDQSLWCFSSCISLQVCLYLCTYMLVYLVHVYVTFLSVYETNVIIIIPNISHLFKSSAP